MRHILFVFVLTLLQLQGPGEAEVHLIPHGYVGHVFIVFRAASGEPSAFEDAARLYRIPQNGILLTQHLPNTGSGPVWKFFYESADGQRMAIERISNIVIPEQRADPTVEIFLWGRGRQQAGQLPCDVAFDHYFVGTKAQMQMSDRIEGLRRLSRFLLTQRVCG
jgi:hypothetical protein